MFCSKCGKTIGAEDTLCPSCQAPIGDSRFGGLPYTSAQFSIAPGQTTFEPRKAPGRTEFDPPNNYTRTTYTGMRDANQENSDVDSRTTYRPVYEGSSVPRSVRGDVHAAMTSHRDAPDSVGIDEDAPTGSERKVSAPMSQSALDTLAALDEELKPEEEIDVSQFRSREIKAVQRPGISRDVSEYIRRLEEGQSRRSARRRSQVYDDYKQEQQGDELASGDYEGDSPELAANVQDESYVQDGYEPELYPEDNYADYSEDNYDLGARPRAGFSPGNIIKLVAVLAAVAALAFGGIALIRSIRDNQSSSPIEGVSRSLYEQGIAALKSSTESTRTAKLVDMYTGAGYIEMQGELDAGRNAILALMPESPAVNDQLFMDTLLAIYDNASNAIIMDGLAVGSSDADAAAKSQERWTQVNTSVSLLETASSPNVLASIIKAPGITVQTETPPPTEPPTPTYANLSKGSEGDEVYRLQNRLYELGYLNDKRDSVFGSKTQTAVKKFQETAGLTASGIADSETQNRLYADDAPYAPGFATPTPKPTEAPTATPDPAEALIQPAEPNTNS